MSGRGYGLTLRSIQPNEFSTRVKHISDFFIIDLV